MARALLLLLAFVAVAACDRVHFHGDKVFRVVPRNEEEVKLLRSWQQNKDVDFWTEAVHRGEGTDIRVKNNAVVSIEEKLKELGVEYSVMIEDLEKVVQQEKEELDRNSKSTNGFNYYTYNRLADIHTEIRRLGAAHPDTATLFSAGTSYEGRDMLAVKISSGSPKPVIWVDGCIHSREWISCASVMNLLKQMLEPEPQFAAKIKKALSKYDFYILPVFNPDGYEYTHTNDRMWRKTRSAGTPCKGADPNRNWGTSHWGGVGTSDDPCTDIYHGKGPFSEIEVKQVADKLRQLAHSVGVKSYWNIHAYSQLVLYPWSWTTKRAKDYFAISIVARAFASGIKEVNGKVFRPGQPSRILYSVAGGSMDWTYEKLGIKYSYAPEMRPKPGEFSNGFLLPAKYIRPSETEFVNGLLKAVSIMH